MGEAIFSGVKCGKADTSGQKAEFDELLLGLYTPVGSSSTPTQVTWVRELMDAEQLTMATP